MPSRLFISYRRTDSLWAATAIHTFLIERFGPENVFKDLESIKPGESWRKALDKALDTCELMLVIIGGEWSTSKSSFWSPPRIKQNGDMVRREISFSLDKEIPVVPLLIDEANLPSLRELPNDIRGLLDLQAARISGASFRADLDSLIERCGLRDKSEIDAVERPRVDLSGTKSTDDLVVNFLTRFNQWAFSPLRIQKWGGTQTGFEKLSQLSTDDIRATLEHLKESGEVEIRTSKKGNTLYRVTKGPA